MVAKPSNGRGTPTVLTVNRDTYRRMTEVRKTAGQPTPAMRALFGKEPSKGGH